MKLLQSPRFLRSLIWAGLISNALAAVVCILCKDWNEDISSIVSYMVWVAQYHIHKNVLKTW